jgi:hypothetical protein
MADAAGEGQDLAFGLGFGFFFFRQTLSLRTNAHNFGL